MGRKDDEITRQRVLIRGLENQISITLSINSRLRSENNSLRQLSAELLEKLVEVRKKAITPRD